MLSGLVKLEAHMQPKKSLVWGGHFYVDALTEVSNLVLKQGKVNSY